MPSTIWSGKPRRPYPWNKPTAKQRAEDEILTRFKTEAERAKLARERYFKSVFVREKFFRLTKRRKAYDEYHRKLHAKRLKDEYAEAIHSALRTSWQQMAQIDELAYQYPAEKAATRKSKQHRMEWLETQKELDNWELKHEQAEEEVESPKDTGKVVYAGKDAHKKPPPGPVPKSKATGGKGEKVGKKAENLEVDPTQLPDPLLWGKQAFAFMEAIQAKRMKEIQDKFEAQQLARKEKLEQEEAQRIVEEAARQKVIDDLHWEYAHGAEALRLQEEQRIADEEEGKKIEYRQKMAQALMEERKEEWNQVTNRDHELLSMMREDYLDEVYQESLLWKAAKERKQEERKAKRLHMCTEIILQIVTMVDIRIDHKAEFNIEMPATNWRGWKTLFVQGMILPCPIFGAPLSIEIPVSDPNSVLAKAAVDAYIDEQGEWGGAPQIGKNKELGLILAEVHGVADSPTEPPPLPDLTQFKLKLAVIGTPFSGKTTVARKLERDFQCVRIDMQNVITSAVALADIEEKTHKGQLAEEERRKVEAETQKLFEEKNKVEFDLQQESVGLKDLYLRVKSTTEVELAEPPPETLGGDPEVDPESETSRGPKSDPKVEKGKELNAASKAEKAKAEQKTQKSKDTKKSPKVGEKQKQDRGKKEEQALIESQIEPTLEPISKPHREEPPAEPPHPLAYLTPKARYGMEVKLAQLEGLQPPEHALAELVMLTLINLQEYADAYPADVELHKMGDSQRGVRPSPKENAALASSKGKGGKLSSKTKKEGDPAETAQTVALQADIEGKTLGFILDGFPTCAREAKALEWRLSGIDVDYCIDHHAKSSRIAPPPELMMKLRSGLDGYFQLQSVNENEAFRRAMGKVVDEKTGQIYHLEYDPPPALKVNLKEKGVGQRLIPVEDLEVVRPKLVGGLDLWAPLCQYLENIVNVFPIAQQEEDGKNMVDTVEPCTLAARFLDGWAKTQAAKVAAQAGVVAETVAFKALADAKDAYRLANEVANKLWCAKLAEVETEQGLDVLGGDTLAKELIKQKASIVVTKRLDEICKAVRQAEEAAEAARVASLHVEKSANLAKDKVDDADLEFAVHVRAEAEEAVESTKQAAIRATEAHKKAIAAFEGAAAALLPKPEISREEKKEGGKREAKDAKGPRGAKHPKDGKGNKEKKGATDAKGVEDEKTPNAKDTKSAKDMVTHVSSPEIASSNEMSDATVAPSHQSQRPPFIEKELAVSLHKEWTVIEANYLQQLETVFYALHHEQALTRVQMSEEKWNRIETPQRIDWKFKPKLQAEVVKLDKALKDICARRAKQCVELSEKSLVSLLDSRTTSLMKVFTSLVQTELDKYLRSCSLLKNFHARSLGFDLREYGCDLEKVTSEPSEKFPVPAWLVTLTIPLPKVYKVFMKAMSVANNVLDILAGKASSTVDGKGKKGNEKKHEKQLEREADKAEKKGKKNLGGKKPDTATVPMVEVLELPLDPSIPTDTAREHEILLHRLQRIAKIALGYFEELQPIVDGAFKRMNEWSGPRLKAEAEVVQQVVDMCKEAAEEQIPLWYRVYLDGDVFQVDESQLVLECPLKEKTNLNLWFCKVLENLLVSFKEVAPQVNYVTGAVARLTLNKAIGTTHAMFKDDLKESLLPRLPASKRNPQGPFQAWQNLADQMFQEIIDDPTKGEKFVDWRALLISLVDAQFSHIISRASCEALLAARTALGSVATIGKDGIAKGPETYGFLAMDDLIGVKLWFDSSARPSEGEYGLGLALKIFLYNLLEDGAKGIDLQKLLLYLCKDFHKEKALQKAFHVVADSSTLSYDHHLTPEAVLRILYPGGIDAAWNQAIIPFILDDLHNMLYYVAKEKWEMAERAKEGDPVGSEESGSNDGHDRGLQGLEVGSSTSNSDHGTVEDFLGLAYQEFPELSQVETLNNFSCHLEATSSRKDPCGFDGEVYPYKCDVHVTLPTTMETEVKEEEQFGIPETYTVADIMNTSAIKKLLDVLYGNYGSGVLQLFDQVSIEDDDMNKEQPARDDDERVQAKKKGKDKRKK